jgi:hypothetical protein
MRRGERSGGFTSQQEATVFQMYRRITRSHALNIGFDEPVAHRVGHPNRYRHKAQYDEGLLFLKYNEKNGRDNTGDDPEHAVCYMNENEIAHRVCDGVI